MMDPQSPTIPGRTKILLLPVDKIKRERFLSFVERLQPENVVHLQDVSADKRPNRNMFSPLAFPMGRIIYDLTTCLSPPSHRELSPFETFREPLVVLGLADGNKLEEQDLRQLYQELEALRDQHPLALVCELLLFDYISVQEGHKLPEGLVAIPPKSASRTTTIKTVMCDVSSLFLAELTTLAKSIQARSAIESPALLQNESYSWSSGGQSRTLSRDSSPSTNPDRRHVRMSMPAQLKSTLSESRSATVRPTTPPDGTHTPPTTFEGIVGIKSPELASPEKKSSMHTSDSIGRDSSRDRVSIQGFGAGSVSERSRNKIRGRVAVIIGSLYLHAGRWVDAQRELIEGAITARANSDHLWHAKALENILTSMLMLAWTGLDFQIPLVCYASADKAAAPIEQKSPTSNRLVSLHNLEILLPELLDRILNLYQRASNFAGESLPQFCFSEVVIRFSKLMTPVHLAGGKINDNVLALIVEGVPFAETPNIRHPRLNVHPTRIEIATMLFRAFPSFSSKEDLSVIDRTIVLGGIASVLGSLGYHRKKAMVTRELVSVLIPGLVQARKIGAAEMGVHPAAGLAVLNAMNGSNSGAGALDLGERDIADGIGEFLDMLCRVYGVVGFRSYPESITCQTNSSSSNPIMYDDSNKTVIARSLHNAAIRSFGGQELKMNVLRACINLCEALPDFQGVLKFTTDLLRTVGSGIAPGSRGEDAAPKMSREEQVRLAMNISRTIGAGKKLGLQNLEAEYWDEFVVRGIELESPPALPLPTPHQKVELLGTLSLAESKLKNPFIYNPLLKKHDAANADDLLVAGESVSFRVTLQNPYDFEIEIESIKLDTEGVLFIAEAQATVLGPYRTQALSIFGIPQNAGSVVVTGCLLKVRGCRERRFPVFNESWIPEREFKIKTIGLKYALPRVEQSNSTTTNFDTTFPGVSPPKLSSLRLDVIGRQPVVVIASSTIKQSAIMVLEGERQTFSVVLRNVSKETSVNLLLFSFQDSTQRKALDIMSNKDTSPADMYELELALLQRQALRWVKDAEAEPYIHPGGIAAFTVEVLGKPGLTDGLVQIDYTYLDVPAANTEEIFYTRQVSLPLTVTVNASIEVARMDILPFSANVPVQLWSGNSAAIQGQEWFKGEDYCLLLLDLRNAWPNCLHVQLNIRDVGLVSEDILPGNVSRVIVPIRKIHLQNPHAPIPVLDPTRQRQFVVSTSRMNVESEQFSREAFWYREELLKIIQGTWRTTSGSERRGDIELRGIRLGPRMVETLKIEDLEIRICSKDSENLTNGDANTGFIIDQCYDLKISIYNRSCHPIYPLLRVQPSLRNQHHSVSLDLAKKLMWNGVLQQTLSILPANEVAEVCIGITALCKGEFEIGACVEEIMASDEEASLSNGTHRRARANTQTLMDEFFREKIRGIWYIRSPYILSVKDIDAR